MLNTSLEIPRSLLSSIQMPAFRHKPFAVPGDWTAKLKASHWRIIEKEIRALAHQPEADDDKQTARTIFPESVMRLSRYGVAVPLSLKTS